MAVYLGRFGFQRLQLFHNLGQGAIFFSVAGMDVAAGGDVVVVFLQLGVIDEAAEFFHFTPIDEGVGNAPDALASGCSFGVTAWKALCSHSPKRLRCRSAGLALLRKSRMPRRAGVVKQIFRQIDDIADRVALHKPFTHLLFFVGGGVAGAAQTAPVSSTIAARRLHQSGWPEYAPAPIGLILPR